MVPKRNSARSHDLPSGPKWGPFSIAAVWLVVIGLLYLLMVQYLKPAQIKVMASGALVIPQDRDGHFYADGTVGGKPVRFLVDTGASMVVISEALAQQAGLGDGKPVVFKTANGDLQGRYLRDVTVAVGPVEVTGVRVGVGLVGGAPDEALLGQSFLNQFDITLSGQQMTLHAKTR